MAADSVPLSTPGVGAVTLDGVIVPFTFTPQDVAKLRGEFRITTAGLANGTHAVSMTVANVAGTPATQNWDFKVAVAPTFSEFAPAASSTVITTTPTISVKVADNSVGGVTGGFTVDGVALPGTYSAATKTLSAHVPTAIPDGAHTAVVSVIDAAGVVGTSTWTFRTSALPVMPTAGTCSSCHPGYPTGHVAGRAACDACHDDLGAAPVDWTNFPHSDEDCTWCHTYANDPPVPFHPVAHDPDSDMSSCMPCHSVELTVEHYRRTDATGAALTCASCHDSATPAVVAAIAAGDTRCGACHTVSSGHEALHITTVDPACTGNGCHTGTSLTSIHINSGTALTCDSCHESTDPDVVSAIATGDKSCAACHDAAAPHGDDTATHAANVSPGTVTFFDGSSDHANGEGSGGVDVAADCALCHGSTNLLNLHANDCSICHSGSTPPRNTFASWNKSCSQGSCHPSYHNNASPGHDARVCRSHQLLLPRQWHPGEQRSDHGIRGLLRPLSRHRSRHDRTDDGVECPRVIRRAGRRDPDRDRRPHGQGHVLPPR